MNEEIRLLFNELVDELHHIKLKAAKPEDVEAIEISTLKLKEKVS